MLLKRILLSLCLSIPLHAQLWSGIVSSPRAADWQNVGATINDSRTQCVTTACATVSGGTVTYTSINAALASAPANTYVLIPAGTYDMGGGIEWPLAAADITIEGSGANSTFLVWTSSSGGSGNCSGHDVCVSSSDTNYAGGPSYTATWSGASATSTVTSGTYTQGGTYISLSSVSGITVGQPIILDQIDTQSDNSGLYVGCEVMDGSPTCYQLDGTWVGLWSASSVSYVIGDQVSFGESSYFCTANNTSSSGNEPGSGGGASYWSDINGAYPSGFQRGNSLATMRGQEQMVTVTSITGSGPYTVGISPGIYAGNWATENSPQAWWAGGPAYGDAVENISLDHTNGGDGITFFNCQGCWVKGIRSIRGSSTGTGWGHVYFSICNHCTVRDSYFFGYTGDVYGVAVDIASDSLVENNIFQYPSAYQFYNSDCEGCVAGYNFSASTLYGASSNWLGQPSDFHSTVLYSLSEGNIGAGHYGDSFHGTHDLDTFFRNRMDGREQNYGNETASSTVAMRMNPGARYYNVVANIMGTIGYHTTYKSTYNAGGSALYDSVVGCGTYPEAYPTPTYDDLSCSTSLWWGNWDNVSNAPRWCGTSSDTGWSAVCGSTSEIPTGATGYPNSNPTVGDTGDGQSALPASFYYSSKPTWWPSGKAWPIIGPDMSGGNVGQCNGGTNDSNEVTSSQSSQCSGGTFTALATVVSNPAMDCYYNGMGGPANGTGAPLSFNASTCYASSGSYTLTVTATNGSVSGTNCASGSYASGTSIGACSATPNSGYTFTGWSSTGSLSCSGA